MLKVLLAFIAFLMSIFAYGQQNYQIVENKIDAIFKDINDTNPGVSLAILKNNKVIIQKNYGLANLEYQIPNTSKTVFHAASVSKQFTAFALLLLEAEGKLSLDDDVRKHIPELNGFNHKITLRNLANHTSGIKDQHNLGRLAGWNSNDIITNDQVLNLLYLQKSLNFSPNEQFMYSNSGYTLLAEVISRVSEQSFSEFVNERIFTPLGMNQSQFVKKSESLIKNKAYAYYSKNGKYQKDLFLNSSVGATNLSTTVNDLSKLNGQRILVNILLEAKASLKQ
jgi:CubicO group peptidase (beta-lactamase class C family)